MPAMHCKACWIICTWFCSEIILWVSLGMEMAFTACTGAGSAAHTSLQSGSHRLLLTFLMLVCNMGMWLMKKKVCLKKKKTAADYCLPWVFSLSSLYSTSKPNLKPPVVMGTCSNLTLSSVSTWWYLLISSLFCITGWSRTKHLFFSYYLRWHVLPKVQQFVVDVSTSKDKCGLLTHFTHVILLACVDFPAAPGPKESVAFSCPDCCPIPGVVGVNGCDLVRDSSCTPIGTGGLEESFNSLQTRIISAGTIHI